MNAVEPSLIAWLSAHHTSCCLIGAAALAARGYARFSADVDLLTVDASVLQRAFWAGFPSTPQLRVGDASDPLVGVVRWATPPVDIVVGRGHAARFGVESAEVVSGLNVPVATPLALVLNKLEAGGGKDQSDIVELIRAQRLLGTADWLADVDAHLPRISEDARQLWLTLLPRLQLAR